MEIQHTLFDLEPKTEDIKSAYDKRHAEYVDYIEAGNSISEERLALLSLYRSRLQEDPRTPAFG